MANDDEEPLMEIENIKKKSDIVGLVERNCILHIDQKRGEQDGGADATVADDENGNENEVISSVAAKKTMPKDRLFARSTSDSPLASTMETPRKLGRLLWLAKRSAFMDESDSEVEAKLVCLVG